MRGRGTDQPDGNSGPLGGFGGFGGLRDEVLGTLKLMFKNVSVQAVPVSLAAPMTAFAMEIPAMAVTVPITPPTALVSEDPIRALAEKTMPWRTLPLITEALLAADAPCTFNNVVSHEPVFAEMELDSHGVSFESMAVRKCRTWPVTPPSSKHLRLPVEKPAPAPVTKIDPVPFKGQSYSFPNLVPKIRTMNTPRFYALPIKKSPIPPNRFPAELREKFRVALAEKAKTSPGNVQLRIIFERMDMSLFSGIQQDELGNLLCTPKNELLGRNRDLRPASNPRQAPGSTAYLVYGVRLDNKEDIRALVPVEDEAR